MPRYLFVLQFDSFVKTLLPVIDDLSANHDVEILLLISHKRKRNWITDHIRELMGERSYRIGNWADLLAALRQEPEVAVLGTVGARFLSRVREFLSAEGLQVRLVSGYVGLLLQNHPRGFLKGVLRRAFTDLIWTPGSEARIRILNTGFINEEHTRIVPTGLPRFDALYHESRSWQRNPERILFIEQPTFPATRQERLQLVEYLAEIARAYPERQVVIKPRFASKVGHTHRPKYLLPDLMREIPNCPPNLGVAEEDLYSQFQATDFALSISSTGALEALLVGIPTYFINDFARDSNRYGSADFKDIGSVISARDVIQHDLPEIDYAAAQAMMRFDGHNTQRLTAAIRDLAEEQPMSARQRPLKVRIKYDGLPKTSQLRQSLEHHYLRRSEQMAVWIHQCMRITPWSAAAQITLRLGSAESLEFKPRILEANDLPDIIREIRPGEKVFRVFIVARQIISLFPVKYGTESGEEDWQLTDMDTLRERLVFMQEWLQVDRHRKGLNSIATSFSPLSGEMTLVINGDEIRVLDIRSRTSPPRLRLSPELKQHLRRQRQYQEERFTPLYQVMDELAWYIRYLDALELAFRRPDYPA